MWLDTLERIRVSTIKLETDYKEAVRQKEEAETGVEASALLGRSSSPCRCGTRRSRRMSCDFAIQGRDATIRELESRHCRTEKQYPAQLGEVPPASGRSWSSGEGRQDSLDSQIADRRARLEEDQAQLEETRRSVEEKNSQAQQALLSAGTLARSWRNCGAGGTEDRRRQSGKGPAVRSGCRRPGGAGPG